MNYRKRIKIMMLVVVVPAALQAQELYVTKTAVPFLRISPDARSGGMGDVGIATAPDANAVWWNAGKLALMESKAGISANYSPWLREMAGDIYYTSLGGYIKPDKDQSIHASVRYFNWGDMQFVDDNGNHLQAFRPREWAVDAGYSRKLSTHSGLGLTVRFIQSNLANKGVSGNDYKAGTALAADLGYYYTAINGLGTGWSFGATLYNLGSKVSYHTDGQETNLPAGAGIGGAYQKAFDEQNKISVAIDINKSLVGGQEWKDLQVSAGSEYWYNNQFALRGGYFYETPFNGNRKYFTIGAGLKYSLFTVNFSYLFPSGNNLAGKNPLANTLRFGLIVSQ